MLLERNTLSFNSFLLFQQINTKSKSIVNLPYNVHFSHQRDFTNVKWESKNFPWDRSSWVHWAHKEKKIQPRQTTWNHQGESHIHVKKTKVIKTALTMVGIVRLHCVSGLSVPMNCHRSAQISQSTLFTLQIFFLY